MSVCRASCSSRQFIHLFEVKAPAITSYKCKYVISFLATDEFWCEVGDYESVCAWWRLLHSNIYIWYISAVAPEECLCAKWRLLQLLQEASMHGQSCRQWPVASHWWPGLGGTWEKQNQNLVQGRTMHLPWRPESVGNRHNMVTMHWVCCIPTKKLRSSHSHSIAVSVYIAGKLVWANLDHVTVL